jgi:6-phosphogluconolactonase
MHSAGRYAYIINELSNTVSTYRLNAEGASCVHSTSALPEGVSGEGMCAAAILISPDDRFLYISHRLEHHPEGDALVWLEILEEGARVTRRGHIRTGQDNLRGAAISRDGRFVITGSRKGKGAVLYERDEDGSLRLVARNEHVVMPSCFVEL